MERDYAEATARTRRFLASRYPLVACLPGTPDYPGGHTRWREVWAVDVGEPTPGKEGVRIILAIPTTFPDTFPQAFLPVGMSGSARIPHLDRRRMLCTFDPTEAQTNSDFPEDIALAVLERAEAEFRDGVVGINHNDFADEFAAYWADADGAAEALSLVPPGETEARIATFTLTPAWAGARWFFAAAKDEGERWLSSVGYAGKATATRSIYVPLASLGIPPYPVTNGELHGRLSAEDAKGLERIYAFLSDHGRPTRILASVPASSGRVLVAWEHPQYCRTVMGKRGLRQVAGPIPGFRAESQPASLEVSKLNAKARLLRASVTDVTPERLARRTAGRTPQVVPGPCNVVGCGSVGGFLAHELARAGRASEVRLVDTQVLTAENTPRHLCGMGSVGSAKADAVAREIGRHFPHVPCTAHRADVLDLLRVESDRLAGASLTVVALGSFAAERRINRVLHANTASLQPPVCFVWVEPFLYGGHAVYLGNNGPGCFECLFGEDFRFSHRVVSDPARFNMREAGCQSTYVPYSGADTVAFISACLRFLRSCEGSTENVALTWTGDLDAARAADVPLQPQYSMPFSSLTRPVVPNHGCPACSR